MNTKMRTVHCTYCNKKFTMNKFSKTIPRCKDCREKAKSRIPK